MFFEATRLVGGFLFGVNQVATEKSPCFGWGLKVDPVIACKISRSKPGGLAYFFVGFPWVKLNIPAFFVGCPRVKFEIPGVFCEVTRK